MLLDNSDAPRIDVFVTCCGEENRVVFNTVRQACSLDYPRDKFRVYVLDDEPSSGFAAVLNDELAAFGNLVYLPRDVSSRPRCKATNFNDGLEKTQKLGGAPFVANIDADVLVHPTWLRRMLPHLLHSSDIGMVSPPQVGDNGGPISSWCHAKLYRYFRNVPSADPLSQSLDLHYALVEPYHDVLGAPFCAGTGHIARRAALDDVGGMPTEALTEDTLCGILMICRGWRIRYVEEAVQTGLVPRSFNGHIDQFTRWVRGNTGLFATLADLIDYRHYRVSSCRQLSPIWCD